jgi:hypothetical protein
MEHFFLSFAVSRRRANSEFFFCPRNRADESLDLTDSHIRTFLDSFITAAQKYNLDRAIALCLFPYRGYTGRLEITQGRANNQHQACGIRRKRTEPLDTSKLVL